MELVRLRKFMNWIKVRTLSNSKKLIIKDEIKKTILK